MRLPVRLVLGFLACLPAVAHATTADDLCLPAADPCIVSNRQITVTDGSIIDLGARTLILRSGSALTVAPGPLAGGTMTLKAGNVTLEGGTALKGSGADINVDVTGTIQVLKTNSLARIDVAGTSPGNIELDADGDILIQGILDAGSGAVSSDGGVVLVHGMNLSVPGTVDVHGGKDATGGVIELDALGSINVSGNVDATGGDGGDVEIDAFGELVTTGKLDLKATLGGGFGGTLVLGTSNGRLALGGTIDMQGEAGGDGGGDGGDLDVFAGESLEITATIDLRGASPDGSGGGAAFSADVDIIQTAPILAQGQGQESAGGSVEFSAERKVVLGSVNAFGGGQGFGGTVVATAWCDLQLPAGKAINATALGGDTTLRSGGAMTIDGTVTAGTANRIYHRTGETPVLNLAGILPAPSVTPDDNLIPCGGLPTPGCGNNIVEAGLGEQCDDNNTDSCDGCSSMCKNEVCGNGVTECLEVCDDGNTASGDGCQNDCLRVENICGDGITDAAETCDDSNTDACDGCSATCQTEACNNGVVECAEECDDGQPGVGFCDDSCQIVPPPNCGDGVVDQAEGEQCDDDNTTDCDGCSSLCQTEGCGNGRVECLESCDDFNTASCDGCSPTCGVEECGNGVLDCFETCDDAGPGSLCLPGVCEQGEFCTSETAAEQPCIACASDLDCDPMGACGPSTCVDNPDKGRKECTPTDAPSCDDGNACTVDACDAATGCVTTPRICDDGQACNGSETCDPTAGCVSMALTCDDGDVCSDDSCDDATGCSYTLRSGLALVSCRVEEINAIVTAAGTDLATPARKKLTKAIKSIRAKVAAAGSTKTKKASRAVKAASKQLPKLGTLVTKLGAQIPAPIASDLTQAIGSATQAIALVPR